MASYLVFDIGATSVKYSRMNEEAQISFFDQFSSEGKDGYYILEEIKRVILAGKDEVRGIAISSTGLINSAEGRIIKSGGFPDLQGLNVKRWINEFIPDLKVTIENDGNCSVFAEKWLGKAKHLDHFVCISIGSAIGGGIYINGKLYRGREFLTGEFGSILTQAMPGSPTLNSVSGMKGLRRRYSAYVGKELRDISGEDLFNKYGQGDYGLDRIVLDFYGGLALFISNLNHMMNPEKFIINGGITKSETFLPMLTSQLKLYGYEDLDSILLSPFKNKANLVGALYYHLSQTQ